MPAYPFRAFRVFRGPVAFPGLFPRRAIRPVVGCFVDAHLFQAQVVAISIPVSGIENVESDLREIFNCRHDFENNGFVIRQACQKVTDERVAAIYQKRMVPRVYQLRLGDAFDVGEVHHHALCGLSFGSNDVAGQRDFNRVAMPVQMFALAGVVGDAMPGVEFQAAGDEHVGRERMKSCELYLVGACIGLVTIGALAQSVNRTTLFPLAHDAGPGFDWIKPNKNLSACRIKQAG